MDISKLKNQLLREAKANPKKAVALGLLLVVALWFWVPLLVGGTEADEQASKQQKPAPEDPAASLAPPEWRAAMQGSLISEAEAQKPSYPWRQIALWREQDPRTLPVVEPVVARDPFWPPPERLVEAESGEDEEENSDANQPVVPVVEELTPQAAGLTLSSTLVSRSSRLALINGKTYRVGDMVPVEESDEPSAVAGPESAADGQKKPGFLVARIDARAVVLERLDKQYTLALAPRSSSQPDRVEMVNFPK